MHKKTPPAVASNRRKFLGKIAYTPPLLLSLGSLIKPQIAGGSHIQVPHPIAASPQASESELISAFETRSDLGDFRRWRMSGDRTAGSESAMSFWQAHGHPFLVSRSTSSPLPDSYTAYQTQLRRLPDFRLSETDYFSYYNFERERAQAESGQFALTAAIGEHYALFNSEVYERPDSTGAQQFQERLRYDYELAAYNSYVKRSSFDYTLHREQAPNDERLSEYRAYDALSTAGRDGQATIQAKARLDLLINSDSDCNTLEEVFALGFDTEAGDFPSSC